MAIRWEQKRPDEVRDYRHDWSAFLGEDTIESSEWEATGVVIDSDANAEGGATVWLSGGTDGTTARLTNTITTVGGRKESETFTLLVRAVDEPVSLAEAKAHLRVLDDHEDALILGYIRAAREWVENYTGHVLVQRTFTEEREAFGRFLEIHRRPVVSVEPIEYTDTDGATQTYENAVAFFDRYPARIHPALDSYWPSLGRYGRVTLTYTAGYAEGEVPQSLIQAMLLLIGHFWVNREAVSERQANEVPFAVKALCDPYRAVSL